MAGWRAPEMQHWKPEMIALAPENAEPKIAVGGGTLKVGMAREKTLITGPYPTSEDIRLIFGMSKADMRRIEREVAQIVAERKEKEALAAARKKAARNAARRKQRARIKESRSR